MGVLLAPSGACCAAWTMELRFCTGVGVAGWLCVLSTVLVLSGAYRSAKEGSTAQGGRLEGPVIGAGFGAVEPGGITQGIWHFTFYGVFA